MREGPHSFLAVHDAVLRTWAEAVATGEPGILLTLPAEEYETVVGYPDARALEISDRREATDGLRRLLEAVAGSHHRAEHRVVRWRSADEVAVAYERILERGDDPLMRFLVVQTWRRADGEWRLARELVEQVSGDGSEAR